MPQKHKASLILIHRKSLETLFVVTRLAQWAGPRTGAGVGSGGYRVRFWARPRVIFYRMCVTFLKNLGDVWGTCSDIFLIFCTCFGHCPDIFSDMFGTIFGYLCDLVGLTRAPKAPETQNS